jgi:hypothetical protein
MKVAMQNTVEHSMKVAMDLEAHEKECAMFRELVHGKLDSLDKRMWRLEAMIMGSTVLVVAMVVSVFMGLR